MEVRIKRINSEWAFQSDKIQLINAGVGSNTTVGILEKQARTSSSISEKINGSSNAITIYSLDDFFADRKVDFLKADIESFEMDMLRGAEKIIRRDLPKIAVCIYHSASDIYQILLWLANLNLNYKFSVRHHRWGYLETVLYAYH